jgi:hypothetical protein
MATKESAGNKSRETKIATDVPIRGFAEFWRGFGRNREPGKHRRRKKQLSTADRSGGDGQ